MVLKELKQAADKLDFIRKNKDAILKEKRKTVLKFADAISLALPATKGKKAAKEDTGRLFVEVVANSTNVLDSDFDVLIPKCYNKTISDNPPQAFKTLKNHNHSIDGVIGHTKEVSVRQMSATDLGGKSSMMVEALVFGSEIVQAYDEKSYQLYKNGGVDQHSIGFAYVNILMAVNDPDDQEGFANWNKYINEIVNKEVAEKAGFFFPVLEIKLFENSAVLFGSNHLTPTLNVSAAKTHTRDEKDIYSIIYQKSKR